MNTIIKVIKSERVEIGVVSSLFILFLTRKYLPWYIFDVFFWFGIGFIFGNVLYKISRVIKTKRKGTGLNGKKISND